MLLLIITGLFVFILINTNKTENTQKDLYYSCIIQPAKKEFKTTAGETVEICFKIQNLGKAVWTSEGKNPYFLSYHLLDEKGNTIIHNNPRFQLPGKIKPSQSFEMTIKVRSPLEKGKYSLEFDLLKEGITWYKERGSSSSIISLLVKEKKWPEDEYVLSLDYGKYTKFHSNLDEINKIYKLIRLTLNKNEVQFEGRTGRVCGFSPGSGYPQIWLRDENTILPASRFFYNKTFLKSWLEEHLAYQRENGSLYDWIDAKGQFDKNTTETDQESSTVQAAYEVFEILGPSWLKKKILGLRIIDRLEKALYFVLQNRFNKEYGLLTGAHTADFGDVDMIDKDQNAVYVDKQTHWTSDIYDQSMFYQACLNLSRMFSTLGEGQKSAFWHKKSDTIKTSTNQLLWQGDKDFYRIHIHLDTLIHDFNEDNMFSLSGNSVAIVSGLADKEKAKRIIEEAIRRQKKYSISTISGILLPPYPKNFFKHHLLDDPYEYQNGGQWDWFGGRFVYSMFKDGFSKIAKEKLIEIINKNLRNRCFFEWDNREGIGRGSDFYCGSAGSLAKAIFEGYFGIKSGVKTLTLEPKLRKDKASVHFYIPANDIFIAYRYQYFPKEKKIAFHYNSNFPYSGKIKILIPWEYTEENIRKKNKEELMVLKDGARIPYKREKINQDRSIIIETDFEKHLLEIKKINQE